MKTRASECISHLEITVLFVFDRTRNLLTAKQIFVYIDEFFDSISVNRNFLYVTLNRMVNKNLIKVVGKTAKGDKPGEKRSKRYTITGEGRKKMVKTMEFMRELLTK